MSRLEITIFRKRDGVLTKTIRLDKQGQIKSDGSACRMTEGTAFRERLDNVESLADLINDLESNEALALGRLRSDLPNKVHVVCKRDLNGKTPGDTIARTGEFLHYAPGKPAVLLLDHDRKGMPSEVAKRLEDAGSFWNAITSVVPELVRAASVERCSTSAGLYHQRTKGTLGGSLNLHVYVAVGDGSDNERALKTLHDRLWLAGYGYFVVGAIGQLLDRSIIDASVYGPERLVFEGPPILKPPVAQDQDERLPKSFSGDIIDTMQAIPPLTEQESQRLAELKVDAKHRLKPQADEARRLWAREFAKVHGLSEQEAERIATQAINHVLEPEFELEFDDPKIGFRTVADVLANPEKYVGETLADPLEGLAYGEGKAKVLRQHDRCLMIHSFAHGGINYQLAGQGVRLDDFRAYGPLHNYFYTPTREPWPAASVNGSIPPVPIRDSAGQPILDNKGDPKTILASKWLDQNRSVVQFTWAPGRSMDIADKIVAEGGFISRVGVTCLNLYRPPNIKPGDPKKAERWVDHVRRLYPKDANHLINWLAQRVQRPAQKINHALLLGGEPGIGKDTILEPLKAAVGDWNFIEVPPMRIIDDKYNGFLRSVILRISEARDLGGYDRYQLYEHLKSYVAAPPNVLRVNEKYLREYSLVNCTGVVITTNHRTDGIYLPANDRRTYVAWSDLTQDDFGTLADHTAYFIEFYNWLRTGGNRHVAAYLAELDIKKFDPEATPPKTAAFWAIVDTGRAPEETELADVLDALDNPDAVTLAELVAGTGDEDFRNWLKDPKSRRAIPHRLETCGYVQIRNDTAADGMWRVRGRRQVVYAKSSLPDKERLIAARKLAEGRKSKFGSMRL